MRRPCAAAGATSPLRFGAGWGTVGSAERVAGASQALRRRPRRRTTSFVVSLAQLAQPVRLCRHHPRHPQFADLDQSLRRGGVSRTRVAEAGDGVEAPVRRRRPARPR